MPSILFVCTGNQYRSPIAAELFRKKLAQKGDGVRWTIGSAGTWTPSGLPPLAAAMELAQSLDVNLDGHMTTALGKKLLEEYDAVLVMEQGHEESIRAEFPSSRTKVHLLSEVVDGIRYDVPDPAGGDESASEIIHDLARMIDQGFENIYRVARSELNS